MYIYIYNKKKSRIQFRTIQTQFDKNGVQCKKQKNKKKGGKKVERKRTHNLTKCREKERERARKTETRKKRERYKADQQAKVHNFSVRHGHRRERKPLSLSIVTRHASFRMGRACNGSSITDL